MRYLFAANFNQARDYAKEQGWALGTWTYIDNILMLCGLREVVVMCVGEYWNHRDYTSLEYFAACEPQAVALEYPDES